MRSVPAQLVKVGKAESLGNFSIYLDLAQTKLRRYVIRVNKVATEYYRIKRCVLEFA
jgi:hypothetical protein